MSEARAEIHAALAELLAYPTADFHQHIKAATALARGPHPEAAAHLEQFEWSISGQSTEQLEELFTRTFDVNPICCLEVGWHLHGDNYDRGDFLVRMRQHLRELGLEEGTELPDHMIHMLPIVGRLAEAEGHALARESIAPALRKMLEGLAGKNNPYEAVLLAVKRVLTRAEAMATGSAT